MASTSQLIVPSAPKADRTRRNVSLRVEHEPKRLDFNSREYMLIFGSRKLYLIPVNDFCLAFRLKTR